MYGKLIIIDGPNGAGKTTVINNLKEQLDNVVVFREPGSTKVGEKIRELLFEFKGSDEPLDLVTEHHLLYAARNELYSKDIRPALESGKIVIVDRGFMSTIAYQKTMGKSIRDFNDILKKTIKDRNSVMMIHLSSSPKIIEERLSIRDANKKHPYVEDIQRNIKMYSYIYKIVKTSNYLKINMEQIINKDSDNATKEIIKLLRKRGFINE